MYSILFLLEKFVCFLSLGQGCQEMHIVFLMLSKATKVPYTPMFFFHINVDDLGSIPRCPYHETLATPFLRW